MYFVQKIWLESSYMYDLTAKSAAKFGDQAAIYSKLGK